MRVAVAAPAPDPRQEIVDLLAAWLAIRVQQERVAERRRRDLLDWSRKQFAWYEEFWPKP